MNDFAEEEKPLSSEEQTELEKAKKEEQERRMEEAFQKAVQTALETVPEEDRLEIQKKLEAEKANLILLALEERGPEFIARRIEWLSNLNAELKMLPDNLDETKSELAKELRRFLDKRERDIHQEVDARMEQTHELPNQALHETLRNILSQVEKTANNIRQEQGQQPMEPRQRQELTRRLEEKNSQKKHLRTLLPEPNAGRAYKQLLDETDAIEKKLYPEKPSNLVEIALMDRAEYVPGTRVNQTLYPYTAEKERQKQEVAEMEHQKIMKGIRASKAAAEQRAQSGESRSATRLSAHQTPEPKGPWWKFWQKRSNPPVESPRG